MRLLYSLAVYAALPVLLPYLAIRGRLNKQAFGFVPRMPADGQPVAWLHAVSVGEAAAAAQLIAALRPHCRLVLTYTTAAGGDKLRREHGEYAVVAQLPLDLPGACRRFFARTRPRLGIVMEAEYWPNLICEAKASGAKLLLANARLSKRRARQYARVAPLMRAMARCFDAAATQTRADARRLAFFGTSNAEVAGNLKFDRAIDARQADQGKEWRKAGVAKPVCLVAGTRAGEEALLMRAMDGEFFARCHVVFAPRHPSRAEHVAQMLSERGISFGMRSRGDLPTAPAGAYIADSLGEMDAWYAFCDVALIGGSFLPFGGQNPIEAMAAGVPAVIGPHVDNYRELVSDASRSGSLQQARTPADAARCLLALCEDKAAREEQGARAMQFCARRRGALDLHKTLIARLLPDLAWSADGGDSGA